MPSRDEARGLQPGAGFGVLGILAGLGSVGLQDFRLEGLCPKAQGLG